MDNQEIKDFTPEPLTLKDRMNTLLEELQYANDIGQIAHIGGLPVVEELVRKLNLNVVIIFGSGDKTIVFSHGENLEETLINAINQDEGLDNLLASVAKKFAKDILN